MRPGKLLVIATAFCAAWLPSCGAQNTPGPAPAPQLERCRSLDQLAPALMESLKGDDSQQLRTVIDREHLWDTQSDGSESPLITLLRVTLATLTAFADDPPEAGAADGQLCNDDSPPPSRDSNRMCEARRILQLFVREGKGIQALDLLGPFIARLLGYVVGDGLDSAHYQVAQVLSDTCARAYCRTEDGLDVLVGLLSFLEPTADQPNRTADVLSLLQALLADPGLTGLMATAQGQMSEADLVAFGKILFENIASLPTDPNTFVDAYKLNVEAKVNDLFTQLDIDWTSPTYQNLRTLLDQVLGPHDSTSLDAPYANPRPLLLDMLDPGREDPVLPPLQAQLACIDETDTNSALLRMVYDLSFTETPDAIGLHDILGALEGEAAIDDRASLLTFAKRALAMIRSDEEGTSAARTLCHEALDTGAAADGGPSNAALVLPVAVSLFENGGLEEVFCVIDTLLYGCTSGAQPACQPVAVGP